jgi:sugar phosphate permease
VTTAEAEKALVRRQDLRIIPLSAAIYFLCYMDRSNIGNAKIMNSTTHNDLLTETGMTNYQYTIALMIFLVAYGLFEVPSNILLKKLRPSRWIAFLMFSWGAITIGLGGATNFGTITGVRFLLGVFEAGLFPGLGRSSVLNLGEPWAGTHLVSRPNAAEYAGALLPDIL